jgi:PAS domain S-box-containing protein
MAPASTYGKESEYAIAQPQPVELEAIARLRLVTEFSLLAEIIPPAVEAVFLPHPDWLVIELHPIWFILTLVLWAATWHPRFGRVWKPAVLLFAAGLILSAGILSIKGASLTPFMFLLVLLPVGGTILPWETPWHCGMCALCMLSGLAFSSQFNWQNHLVISGLSAMIASMLGCHSISLTLAEQRKALTRSEEKFRKIFEMSGSLIAIYSIPDSRIVDVNAAWEKTFGYNRKEVLGRSPADLGLTPDRHSFGRWVSSLKVGNAGAEQLPAVLHGRHNKPVHCVYSWTTLELDGHDCILVVGQDVTARVQAEEELRRNREVLVNQERLKAVGELASGIAHDLNNSLNALRLRVELLCTDSTLLPRHNDSLQLISRIVGDAAATIGRLQDFARRRHDQPVESVDLSAIISQSVDIAKSTLEEKNSLLGRSIQIEMEVSGLPPILGEPTELRQIFLNLLLNAQDAMLMGGTIRITGRIESEAIVVRVEDEGQGIPEEHLSHIFDPFFSTKGERGTGLGLSIAYAAMARIGGTISAANRAEGGAIFRLVFPVARTKPTRDVQHGSAQIRPLRVLVTDDDQGNLQAFSALLEARGHNVIRANSGFEALDKLKKENVDVVFCDLGMPQMNGWEVARRMKSLKTPPTFYLVTGWAVEIPADDPRRRFVDAVIAKPIGLKILDELLAQHTPRSILPSDGGKQRA